MAALISSLAADPRRIVLIDSPPLLVTSEAGVLAALAGQVVLVVKASETPQEIVLRAVETLPEDKAVSLVLNQVLSVPERGYGHYGYYGDYGYRRKPEEKAEPIDDESA
jgi:Mrp family chromosome partitioning ATPase